MTLPSPLIMGWGWRVRSWVQDPRGVCNLSIKTVCYCEEQIWHFVMLKFKED